MCWAAICSTETWMNCFTDLDRGRQRKAMGDCKKGTSLRHELTGLSTEGPRGGHDERDKGSLDGVAAFFVLTLLLQDSVRQMGHSRWFVEGRVRGAQAKIDNKCTVLHDDGDIATSLRVVVLRHKHRVVGCAETCCFGDSEQGSGSSVMAGVLLRVAMECVV